MLVTEREDVAATARLLRCHGLTGGSTTRDEPVPDDFDVVINGFEYGISEAHAAVARVGLGITPVEDHPLFQGGGVRGPGGSAQQAGLAARERAEREELRAKRAAGELRADEADRLRYLEEYLPE